MIHSGDPTNDYVDVACRHVLLRQGVLGIKSVARAVDFSNLFSRNFRAVDFSNFFSRNFRAVYFSNFFRGIFARSIFRPLFSSEFFCGIFMGSIVKPFNLRNFPGANLSSFSAQLRWEGGMATSLVFQVLFPLGVF
jgi:hypothetical protein